MTNGFSTSDVISIVAITISLLAFLLTLYFNHLRGSDIQLVLSLKENTFLKEIETIWKLNSDSLKDDVTCVAQIFEGVLINKGNHSGTVFRLWGNKLSILDASLELRLKPPPPITLQPGENVKLEYRLNITGNKEYLEELFKNKTETKFEICYKVTHRNNIQVKRLPIKVKLCS